MSKLTETQDVLLDAIKTTAEEISEQYRAGGRVEALKTLALAYRYAAGGDQPQIVDSPTAKP